MDTGGNNDKHLFASACEILYSAFVFLLFAVRRVRHSRMFILHWNCEKNFCSIHEFSFPSFCLCVVATTTRVVLLLLFLLITVVDPCDVLLELWRRRWWRRCEVMVCAVLNVPVVRLLVRSEWRRLPTSNVCVSIFFTLGKQWQRLLLLALLLLFCVIVATASFSLIEKFKHKRRRWEKRQQISEKYYIFLNVSFLNSNNIQQQQRHRQKQRQKLQ